MKKGNFALIAGLIILSVFGACRKDKDLVPSDETDPPVTAAGTRTELTTDSIFLYAREVYLWNSSLPTYEVFNPRQYASSAAESGFSRELFDLTRYGINPASGLPYELYEPEPTDTKYSYLFNTDDANPVAVVASTQSSVDLEGNGYDLGLEVQALGTSNFDYELYVLAVSPNSPAAKAGMTRGDIVTSVNGQTIGSNYNNEKSTIDDAFFNNSIPTVTLKGTKRSGAALNVTLSVSSYRSSPVYADSVYTVGGKKIGYLAFASFTTGSNANTALDKVFTRFTTAGVSDLIIDLRYNGGGYVSTAEYLTNLIAPPGLTNKTMFSEHYNDMMSTGKATILKNQPYRDANDKIQYRNGKMVTYADQDYSVAGNTVKFSKKGNLNDVSTVVFIISGNTASASELVINNLKPHLNVKLVGEKSYGKPVGFFPLRIDKYDLYLSMFQSKNSKGEGDYFTGFTPDATADDDPRFAFGDLAEESFYKAHYYLANKSFPSSSSTTSSLSTSKGVKPKVLEKAARDFPIKGFKGMIEDRIRLK